MNKLAKAILLGLATSGYVAGAPSPCPEGYTRACPDGSAFFHASASASVMPCNGMPAICVASALAPGAPEAMPAYDPQDKVPFWIRATATEPKTDADHASSSAIDTDGESKIGTGRQLKSYFEDLPEERKFLFNARCRVTKHCPQLTGGRGPA